MGILKSIVIKKMKEGVHMEETFEEFARTSHEIQARFKFLSM